MRKYAFCKNKGGNELEGNLAANQHLWFSYIDSKTTLLTEFLLPKSIGNTQEVMAPSKHDRKIVYWDVKNQINQPTNLTEFEISNISHLLRLCSRF